MHEDCREAFKSDEREADPYLAPEDKLLLRS
jgi:hypothetical protein